MHTIQTHRAYQYLSICILNLCKLVSIGMSRHAVRVILLHKVQVSIAQLISARCGRDIEHSVAMTDRLTGQQWPWLGCQTETDTNVQMSPIQS